MADVVPDPDQDLAVAFGLLAESDAAVQSLVNVGLLQIRNSRDVALARADVVLQAAEAAAEQVQDIRIDLLENPEANYSSFVVEVLLTIAFETTIAGLVLSKLSKALFSHVMASTALAMRRRARALLAPTTAQRLSARANRLWALQDLRRYPSGPKRVEAVRRLVELATDRSGKARQLMEGFAARSAVPPSVASDTREALKRFHGAISVMARGGGDVNENLSGTAQTAAALARAPSAGASLGVADSPGVRLLTEIQGYATRLRLTIQIVHNELEKSMLDQLLEPDMEAYLEILEVCIYRDVRPEAGDLARIDADLHTLRDQYRWVFEVVIWAHLFGFRRGEAGRPERPRMEQDQFAGIPSRLTDYWIARFGPQLDARNAEASGMRRFPGMFKDLNRQAQVFYLRNHFWMAMDQVKELEGTYLRDPMPVTLGTWW